jgi:hypothetical protein
MSKLTDKVVQAGLIPDHTLRLLARWGCLSPEEMAKFHELPDQTKQKYDATLQQLLQLVNEIEELLEEKTLETDIREVDLDAQAKLKAEGEQYWVCTNNDAVWIDATRDRLGRFILPAAAAPRLRPGDKITVPGAVPRAFEIVDVEPRYEDNVVAWHVCQVEEVIPRA